MSGERGTVTGNAFWRGQNYTIYCTSAHYCSISNNSMYDAEKGIYLTNSNYNSVVGNTMEGVDDDGITLLTSNHNIVSSNNIHDCSEEVNNSFSGILLTGTSTHNVITGNRVSSNAANKHRYGIRENAAADDFNLIHGNICSDSQTAEISSQGPSSQVFDNIEA